MSRGAAFSYSPLLPIGDDLTEYRLVMDEGVDVVNGPGGRRFLTVATAHLHHADRDLGTGCRRRIRDGLGDVVALGIGHHHDRLARPDAGADLDELLGAAAH